MLVLKSQTAFAILAIFECERRAEIGYHVNQGATLYNQQTSNHSIGHKCLEFPRTRFHNCRPPLICAPQSEIGRDKFCQTCFDQNYSVLYCGGLGAAEIRCHLNEGAALCNQEASNHSIGQLCLGTEFPGKGLSSTVF